MSKVLIALLVLCTGFSTVAQEADPPQVMLGERLFRETRFAHFFFAHFGGQWNKALTSGEPSLEHLEVLETRAEHPYRGRTMSCAGCHFVDQANKQVPYGVRLYNDFSRRTPIDDRGDGINRTIRNTSQMVGTTIHGQQPLHWDGEFFDGKSLTRASLVGRNMGWLPTEAQVARQHIIAVVRNDDGSFPSDADLQGNYRDLFQAMPAPFGLDVATASDEQIFENIVNLIAVYMNSLDFSRDDTGAYNGSAYDQFVKLNQLPAAPAAGESKQEFIARLQQALRQPRTWQWVEPKAMKYHSHPTQFKEAELDGFMRFVGHARCVQCHTPPDFTDLGFHNVGVAQTEYELLHGRGSFAKLKIPSQQERLANADLYFNQGVLKRAPRSEDPSAVDFGAWNVFLNPTMDSVQAPLREAICRSLDLNCSVLRDEEILNHSVAVFKTPSLRSNGQTAPFFHNGAENELMSVILHYMRMSRMASAGKILNADPVLGSIKLNGRDTGPLIQFLQSLDEDYD